MVKFQALRWGDKPVESTRVLKKLKREVTGPTQKGRYRDLSDVVTGAFSHCGKRPETINLRGKGMFWFMISETLVQVTWFGYFGAVPWEHM